MSRYLKNSVADIDELYEVVADAYRNDVLLNYCLKCFKLFLSQREKLKHDETHGSEEDCYICRSTNMVVVPSSSDISLYKCIECRLIENYKMTKVKPNTDGIEWSVGVEIEESKFENNTEKKYKKCLWCKNVSTKEMDLNAHVKNHFETLCYKVKNSKIEMNDERSSNPHLKCS